MGESIREAGMAEETRYNVWVTVISMPIRQTLLLMRFRMDCLVAMTSIPPAEITEVLVAQCRFSISKGVTG